MDYFQKNGASEATTLSSDGMYLRGNLTEWQRSRLEGMTIEGVECLVRSWKEITANPIEGILKATHCGPNWDGDYCWPATLIGDTAKLPCLEDVRNDRRGNESTLQLGMEISIVTQKTLKNFDGYAYRTCLANESWDWKNQTDDSECLNSVMEMEVPSQEWLMAEVIRYVLFIGSILSLLFLGTSLFIFCYLKSIRCDRITLHIHFMISLALKSLVLVIISDPYLFGKEYHYRSVEWICKLVLSLNLYTYVSSINWMFVQGHYLNSKLTTDVFQTNFHIKSYCCFGWGLPIVIVSGWCTGMEALHGGPDNFCWKGYSSSRLIWIVVAPVLAALLANLAFLVSVTRVLLTKLQLTSTSTDREQFRRAAKSTMVLFPLLGINNLIFFFNPGGSGQIYYMLANAILQPLQGVLVAVLYCFVTNDVQAALKTKYNQFSSRRDFRNDTHRNKSGRCILTMTYKGVVAGTAPEALDHANIARTEI